MFYPLLKIGVRLALPFFARHIRITNPGALKTEGPLVLAVNHPNSFLDAILLGTYMQAPVHFITRGDVFRHPWVRRILGILNMIPIYRIRDGKEKLSLNEETFLRSVEVLRNNGVLLIFVEGFCNHQTTLQLPLKKGAPRILQSCWQQGIPARVLPVWLQYSSFRHIGKTIHIRLGEVFGQEVAGDINSATCMPRINAETGRQLLHLHNAAPFVHAAPPAWKRVLLLLPALLGAVLHAPLFLPLAAFTRWVSRDNVHYDSILLVLLFVSYPVCLLAVALSLFFLTGQWLWWPLTLLGLPALAMAFIHWKTDESMQ
jgi:1-acyl-sn-glycerol-3-phosphate acyltransferase